MYENKGFTFCINQPHNTIGSRRDRVYFALNIFIIGLGSVVLFILSYLWYLAVQDASLSAVSLFVGATVTAIACLSSISFQPSLSGYGLFITFQASLRGYDSFIAEYFARIRNSDFLLMAFLFVSGPLLALGTAKLVVTTSLLALGAAVLVLSFAALSHGYLFILITIMCITHIRAFVTFILFLEVVLASSAVLLAVFRSFFAFVTFILILGEVLASGVAMLAMISSFLACIRYISLACIGCISFGIIPGLACICLSVLDVIYIVPPLRVLCIAIVMLFGLIASAFSHVTSWGCFALSCVVLLYCLTCDFN